METGFEKHLLDGAYNGISQIVKTSLDLQTNIETKDDFGDTALNKACDQGHFDIVKLLIERGANINNLGGADLSPIMNAATNGYFEITQYLIEKGAEISNDLLSAIQMKVNILEENAEMGMVNPEGAKAWKQFLEYLISKRKEQES
ncbi:MAG: ankyrin repeat domain-containing protein [Bacteroidales bacterium]|nr:ankyrin repeat domain-containing protein [Bacteroidales bacterium]MBN2756187.1 ankyrin repeat domain-containing protein [Bacteroidales bacterium]